MRESGTAEPLIPLRAAEDIAVKALRDVQAMHQVLIDQLLAENARLQMLIEEAT